MERLDGDPLTISAEDAAVQRNNPRSDVAFQRLLLKFSDAAAQGTQAQELIRLFCQASREFFQVDGTYFWQRVSADELVGAEADGVMADRFRGTRVNASQGSVAIATDAIRRAEGDTITVTVVPVAVGDDAPRISDAMRFDSLRLALYGD